MQQIKVEIIKPEDWLDFKKIRQEALAQDYEAFHFTKNQALQIINRDDSEWEKDLKNNNYFFVVAEHNSEPVGMAQGKKRSAYTWILDSVYLKPEFRKKIMGGNISDSMVGLVLEEIKNQGGRRVVLGVEKQRIGAVKLYERFGFKKANPLYMYSAFKLTKLLSMFKHQTMKLDLGV